MRVFNRSSPVCDYKPERKGVHFENTQLYQNITYDNHFWSSSFFMVVIRYVTAGTGQARTFSPLDCSVDSKNTDPTKSLIINITAR